jgi:hypothetical protein
MNMTRTTFVKFMLFFSLALTLATEGCRPQAERLAEKASHAIAANDIDHADKYYTELVKCIGKDNPSVLEELSLKYIDKNIDLVFTILDQSNDEELFFPLLACSHPKAPGFLVRYLVRMEDAVASVASKETIDRMSGNGLSSSPTMEAAMANAVASGILTRLFTDYAAKALLSLDIRDKNLAWALAKHLDSCKVDSVQVMAHRYIAGMLPIVKKDGPNETTIGPGLTQLRNSLKRHDRAGVSVLHSLLLAPRQNPAEDETALDKPSVKQTVSGMKRMDSTMIIPKNLLFLQSLIEQESGDERVARLYDLLALVSPDSQIAIVNAIADRAPNEIRRGLPQFILEHGNASLMPAFEKMLQSGNDPADMVTTAQIIQRFGGADKIARLRRVMLDSYEARLINSILIIDLMGHTN